MVSDKLVVMTVEKMWLMSAKMCKGVVSQLLKRSEGTDLDLALF